MDFLIPRNLVLKLQLVLIWFFFIEWDKPIRRTRLSQFQSWVDSLKV